MIFSSERELVNAYLEKCKKTGWCEITQTDFSSDDFFTEFSLPGFGRIDLMNFTFGANPTDGLFYGIVKIVEFKNGRLCRDDIVQINRYYQGIKYLIESGENIKSINHRYANIYIGLYLVGNEQNFNPDTMHLVNSIPNLQILTHKIVNGEIEINPADIAEIEYEINTETPFYKCLTAANNEWHKIYKSRGDK